MPFDALCPPHIHWFDVVSRSLHVEFTFCPCLCVLSAVASTENAILVNGRLLDIQSPNFNVFQLLKDLAAETHLVVRGMCVHLDCDTRAAHSLGLAHDRRHLDDCRSSEA